VTDGYAGDRFFVRRGGRLLATPLFVVLLAVETTDLVFAVDSIPAIFGVTTDTFLIYSSNAFAILGLRSLYFVLADAVARLAYLRLGLAAILVFVGGRMIGARWVHLPVAASLLVIVACLGLAALASLARNRRLMHTRPLPATAGRLWEQPRTALAPDEAFGCARRVRGSAAVAAGAVRPGSPGSDD
jgi:tellurite resistance protein TerC